MACKVYEVAELRGREPRDSGIQTSMEGLPEPLLWHECREIQTCER